MMDNSPNLGMITRIKDKMGKRVEMGRQLEHDIMEDKEFKESKEIQHEWIAKYKSWQNGEEGEILYLVACPMSNHLNLNVESLE
jgi:hypothetical protein